MDATFYERYLKACLVVLLIGVLAWLETFHVCFFDGCSTAGISEIVCYVRSNALCLNFEFSFMSHWLMSHESCSSHVIIALADPSCPHPVLIRHYSYRGSIASNILPQSLLLSSDTSC